MKDQKIINKIKSLKKWSSVGIGLCYLNFIILGAIVESLFPNRRPPGWTVIVITLISSVLMFPPLLKLSNVRCPRCKTRLNLWIISNTSSITCRACGHIISQKQSGK